MKHGIGIEFLKQRKFIGTFSKNRKHGIGAIIKNGAVVYVGNWKSGKKIGYCCYNIAEGHTYEGTVEFDMRHGFGRLTNKKIGVMYTGEYKNNQKHGFGKFETQESVYIGYFKKGVKHGLGYMKYLGSGTKKRS